MDPLIEVLLIIKINIEVLKDKDYIPDSKNMLLEVQVDCENKCNKFQWEYIKI